MYLKKKKKGIAQNYTSAQKRLIHHNQNPPNPAGPVTFTGCDVSGIEESKFQRWEITTEVFEKEQLLHCELKNSDDRLTG